MLFFTEFLVLLILIIQPFLDALISPISLLANNWVLSLVLIFMFGLLYLYLTRWMPKLYKYFRVKKWYQKIYNIEKWDKRYAKMGDKNNLLPALMFLFFYFLFL